MMKNYLKAILLVAGCSFTSCENQSTNDYSSWTAYSGTKDASRYSSGTQINKDNVHQLEVAWTYSTNDKDTANRSQIQTNPIVIDGILYGVSPQLKLFALDAATGEQKWLFDPAIYNKGRKRKYGISRGVVYWQDEQALDKRILYGVNERLYAIDVLDGKPVKTFGENGSIDLREDLDLEDHQNKTLFAKTPGVVYKDLLITGTSVSEGADALPGHIRAFDIRTGERKWIFHTIPQPGQFGYDTWKDKDAWKNVGGANNWAGMSLDEKRGIVYVPTGSATPDFYGGFREGPNLFANSLIALDAATGEYIWHYQIIHHDMWDRDLPANPNLVTIKPHGGKEVDAIAQIAKQGNIFVFDRTNGEPVFPIEEKPVPQNALPGEKPWPTQPVPTLPEPFVNRTFTVEDLNDRTPEIHKDLLERYKNIKYSEPFTPPTKEGAWIFPDFDGGGSWGGAAVDVETQILYVNADEIPASLTMKDAPVARGNKLSEDAKGLLVYNKHCITCHGAELQGSGEDFPSLQNLDKRLSTEEARQFITNGGNRMPSFQYLSKDEKENLITFLFNNERKTTLNLEDAEVDIHKPEGNAKGEVPYVMTGYKRFEDKDGYPGNKPPWGTLNAVDLNTGKLLWKVPLGEYPELKKKNVPPTGTRNYGGPVVTKGGLVFIAATVDEKIRAFDKSTGEVLWEGELPAAGYATPAVYVLNGKQYVVIACGGGKLGSKSGDSYVAFALPDKNKSVENSARNGVSEKKLAEWNKKRAQVLQGM
jgi:quinoprotein glucose dehydrogenase